MLRGLLVALALAAAGRARAVQLDALEPQRDYRLAALRFVGTHAVKAGTLRDAMLTKARPWYAVWRGWPTFDPVTFRTDLQRIRRVYENHGYYGAIVEHDVELPAAGDDVTAVVYVEEGPAVHVADLRVDLGGEPLPETERTRLLGNLPLKQGDVFTADAYTRTETSLRGYYREHGYARVQVTRQARVDPARATATVTYRLVSGAQCVFGETRITGTERITRGTIRRELAYEPGDPFRQSKLDRTRQSLLGLNLFRTIRIEEEPAEGNRIDLHVHVVETPPHEIRLGVGYETEDGPRGLASWRSYDFLGGARQLGFTARVSMLQRTLAADFLQPHFPGRDNRTRLLFAEQQEDEDTFDLDRTRLSPRFEWQATSHVTGFAFYRIEYDSLSNVPLAVRDFIRRSRRGALAPSNGFLSGFGFGADWNHTDDLIDPKRGWVTSATVEPVGGVIGGDIAFLRMVGEGRFYQPLVGKLLGAARLRVGAADPIAGTKDIPLFERFYAGGIDSVRGYGRWRIGPLVDDHPIGGRTLVDWSVELRHPITDLITGATFLDAGGVAQRSYTWHLGDLRYGTGIGALVRTPIGPARVDLGFPIQPPDGDQRWQVHLSLGAAF